ncbi:MAG TPA: class I adenylate-forming enzyme family protein [Flavisolibacter sp.]|jgi:acyl-CoA synthetase (AMP-forming)/AMP-acid ligase II
MNPVNPVLHLLYRQQADNCYLRTPDRSFTYGEVLSVAEHLAGKYRMEGTVALNFENPLLLCLFCWAALSRNTQLVLLPSITGREALDRLLPHSGIPVFTDIASLKEEDDVCFVDSIPGDIQTFTPLEVVVDDGLVAGKNLFFYSSGTTGQSKLVPVSYAQLTIALNCIRREKLMEYTVGQCLLLSPPLYHSYGFSAMMEYTAGGSSLVLPADKTLGGYLKILGSEELRTSITAVEGVPYFHEQLKLILHKLKLSSLRHVGFGGDAVSMKLLEFYRSHAPQVSFSIRYGLTEIPSVLSLLTLQRGEELCSNGSRILPLYKVSLTKNEEGSDGDISVGYDLQSATSYGPVQDLPVETIPTGDTGYISEGRLVITGRKKYMGKIRGYTVNAQVLEKLLSEQPFIEEACVILQGQKLFAQVQLAPNSNAGEEEIRACIRQHLPDHYQPDQVNMVDSIARTETGKKIRHLPREI